MKTLTEYIELYKEPNLLEEEELIDESRISDLADKVGTKVGKITGLWNDIKNFGRDSRAAYQKMLLSLTDKKNEILSEEDKKKLIENIKDVDGYYSSLVDIMNRYKNVRDAYKDSSYVYAVVNVQQIAKKKKDKKTYRTATAILDNIPAADKKSAIDSVEKAKQSIGGNDGNGNTPTDKTGAGEQKQEEIVKKTVEKDEIKKVAEPANIDTKELADYICQIIIPSDDDYDIIQDQAVALAEIICGMATLQNNEKIKKDILAKYGIKDIDEFINKIKTENKK